MSPRALLLCVLVAAGVSLFFWDTLPLYPFRLLVTLMHETGHALAAKLVGGDVASVTISPTAGGLTQYSAPQSFWRPIVTGSAGYVGSAISGAVLLAAAGRMRTGKVLLWGLVGWMVIVAVLWVPLFAPAVGGGAALASGYSQSDGMFTLAFIVGTSIAFGLVATFAPVWIRRLLIVFVATLSCLAALQDIKGLFGYGLERSSSDADAMSRLTHVPAAVWAALWMVMAVFAITLGLRSMLKQRRRFSAPTWRRAA
jgi:hypothetical protein